MFNLWSINGGMGYMRRYAGVGGVHRHVHLKPYSTCFVKFIFNFFSKN